MRNYGVYSDSLLCWTGWAYFKNLLYHKIFHAKDCFVHFKSFLSGKMNLKMSCILRRKFDIFASRNDFRWYNFQKGLALSNDLDHAIPGTSFLNLVIGKSSSI